jgi:SAM-dependent methyltransferase
MATAYEYDDRMSTSGAPDWWSGFFDEEYLRLWGPTLSDTKSDADAEAVWELLGLREGSRVLDAPCGFGRLAYRLAARGADVLGVDVSQRMIDEAAKREGVRLLRHDLREPLAETGFDAAYNVFSSIGYVDEEGDARVFRTVHAALRPNGKFLVETRHRDDVVLEVHKAMRPAGRFGDGTLMIEELSFDPVAGRVDTVWHYSGPNGSGSKPASWRIYSITELIALLARCGFKFVSAHAGLTTAPFTNAIPYPRRVAVLCERA